MVSIESFQNIISSLACLKCRQQHVKLLERRQGMVSILCENCNEIISKVESSHYNFKNKTYDNLLLTVCSTRQNGIGYTKLVNLSSFMDIPKPISLCSYQLLNEKNN